MSRVAGARGRALQPVIASPWGALSRDIPAVLLSAFPCLAAPDSVFVAFPVASLPSSVSAWAAGAAALGGGRARSSPGHPPGCERAALLRARGAGERLQQRTGKADLRALNTQVH